MEEGLRRLRELVPQNSSLQYVPEILLEFGEPPERILKIASDRDVIQLVRISPGREYEVRGISGIAGRDSGQGVPSSLEAGVGYRIDRHLARNRVGPRRDDRYVSSFRVVLSVNLARDRRGQELRHICGLVEVVSERNIRDRDPARLGTCILNGRDHRVRSGIDYRNRIGPGIRDI